MMKEFGQLSGHFTAPARGGDPSSLIVIMHGWGADASDLADLAGGTAVEGVGIATGGRRVQDPRSHGSDLGVRTLGGPGVGGIPGAVLG